MFEQKKILMVLPERLGDTLMTTPAIHYLKHYYPNAQVDVICVSDLCADTVKNNPDIKRIFISPSHKTAMDLAGHYDIGINIHDGPQAREYFSLLKLDPYQIEPADQQQHQAEQALRFMQRLLPGSPDIVERQYRIFPHANDFKYIESILAENHIDLKKDILIGCHLGCHSVAKRGYKIWRKPSHPKVWPFNNIIALAQRLQKHNPHIHLVVTGSNSEQVLAKKLCKKVPGTINLIDQTTVAQLAALMKYLNVFITPDTGVMHVACSTHVPMIALFGPTSLTRTGPYPELENLTLLQAPRMEDISVDEVFNAVLKKIEPSK